MASAAGLNSGETGLLGGLREEQGKGYKGAQDEHKARKGIVVTAG